MSEQTLIYGAVGLSVAALVCGFLVRDSRAKLSVIAGGAVFWFLYSVFNAPSVREGMGRFVFLFILFFMLPFSFGATLAKRFGPKD